MSRWRKPECLFLKKGKDDPEEKENGTTPVIGREHSLGAGWLIHGTC